MTRKIVTQGAKVRSRPTVRTTEIQNSHRTTGKASETLQKNWKANWVFPPLGPYPEEKPVSTLP